MVAEVSATKDLSYAGNKGNKKKGSEGPQRTFNTIILRTRGTRYYRQSEARDQSGSSATRVP